MTRPTLDEELLNAWNEVIEKLTPEERQRAKDATSEEWSKAIAGCIKDPQFWANLSTSLVEGLFEGINKAIEDFNNK